MAVLSTHLAADAIIHIFEGLFDKMHWWHPLIYISFGLFFVVMISVTFLLKNRIYLPQTKIIPGGAQRRKHLILFLSNLDDLDELNKSNGIPEALTLTHNINDDIEKMKELKKRPTKLVWKWEMPLRAIKHHIETLTTLTIICSDKSLPQVHLFLNICRRLKIVSYRRFYWQKREIYCTLVEKNGGENKRRDFKSFDKEYEGFNFEDFNALSNAMA
ncbi:MAG: hypothetical protein MRK02_04580 [Candidatus Scalindua sp.]|nr:hypothetical protein [Candidatus Scalindua sp.]